jgi:hypothetical protein
MRQLVSALSIACCCLLACAPGTSGPAADDDDDGDGGTPVATALVIDPASAEIEVTDGQPVDTSFTVTATLADGSTRDVTGRVVWNADGRYGSVSSGTGTFRTVGQTAGPTPLSATYGGQSVSAGLVIRVHQHHLAEGAPAGAAALFSGGATLDPGQAPTLVYPPRDVTMPKNLGSLDVHWTDSHGHDAFEAVLRSQYGDVHVVSGVAPSYAVFGPEDWALLSRGDSSLTVELFAGTTAQPGTIGSAVSQQVHLTDEDIAGGIYYWAASSSIPDAPYGIFRHDVARAGQAAEPFYTTTESNGRCVACHAISRDGKHMTITYDGGDGAATLLDVATRTARPDVGAWNFAVYTPSGDRLLTMHRGVATMRDPDSGAVLDTLSLPLAGSTSQYEFSTTGTFLTFINTSSFGSDYTFRNAAIGTAPYDPVSHTVGAPTIIVPAIGQNNYFPSISPDGAWIVFDRSDDDGYDDPSASLWTVAAGGGSPIHLDAADTAGVNLTNSWTRWAPFATHAGGEPMFWITFSSKRDFGVRLVGQSRPQIWMAPFFPDRAALGMDPTGPAFWLPFQDLETDNHIAQWTETVVPIE